MMKWLRDADHALRVLVVLVVLGVSAGVAQHYLRPQGFGVVGHYRVGSLQEIMAQEPVHQGKTVCSQCHREIYDVHQKDIHYNVQCEDCHGQGQNHARYHTGEDETVPEAEAAMQTGYTLEGCLFCHRKLTARPKTFPQVDRDEHFQFLHVIDSKTRCNECHSPHEPLFLLTDVNEARIHPVIYECADCHDDPPEKDYLEIAAHPVIFTCNDCHRPIVSDFKSREHSFMPCTACHLFHRENDTAGRIFKNGNRRFCLLCHEKQPFKDETALPQIVSILHITEMAELTEMDASELEKDPRACLECHFDYIHDSNLVKRQGVLSDE